MSIRTTTTPVDERLRELITACHILHSHDMLQETGSVSVRHPSDPMKFFASTLPAILTTSPRNIGEYSVTDGAICATPTATATASQPTAQSTEPLVHSCIYARYPGVRSVIHGKNLDGIVYGLCDAGGSMILPAYNNSGFIGTYNPIFNPAAFYDQLPSSQPHDLRISHPSLGEAMAEILSTSENAPDNASNLPDFSCVLLRGNGVAVWGATLKQAVHKAIHLQRNGAIQAAAMLQRTNSDLNVTYLNHREAIESENTTMQYVETLWEAWVAEVERDTKYRKRVNGVS